MQACSVSAYKAWAFILQEITPRAVIFNNEILLDYSIPNLVVLYLHYIIERTILLFHSSVPFYHFIPALHSTDSRHPSCQMSTSVWVILEWLHLPWTSSQPASYKSPYNWLVRLGMDLCFVCYVELKLVPTDAIWLFSVQTYP